MDTKELIIEQYNKQIADLDKEHAEWLEKQIKPGNNAQTFQQVGANMLAEKEYQDKRNKLVRQRDDIIGVSPGVEAFLNDKPQFESKIDVQEGRATVDNSLNPLGGKDV